MPVPARVAMLAIVLAAGSAPPAAAADLCVGVQRAGCEAAGTLADALAAARDPQHPDADRILLGGGDHVVPAGPADAAGQPVEISGAGAGATLTATAGASETLWMSERRSRVERVTVDAPDAGATAALRTAGTAADLTLRAAGGRSGPAVRLEPGAALLRTSLDGLVVAASPARIERVTVAATGGVAVSALAGTGEVVVDTVEVQGTSLDAAFAAPCGATMVIRSATVVAGGATAVRGCDQPGAPASPRVRSSVLAGEFSGGATTGSATSAFTEVLRGADITGQLDDAHRPRPASRLVDAGDPDPLAEADALWDLGGRPRIADGDGNGVLRRDIGAWELQLAAVAVPAANVLVNPAAEEGTPGAPPPGWTRTGSFTAVPYGTAFAGEILLPTIAAGQSLGGGGAFFSAGDDPASSLLQRIDLNGSAERIDTGKATAELSGLLGGYGSDDDAVSATATFLDPEGRALGVLRLGPVTAADRARGTTLLHRTATRGIPPRTRAVDVSVAGSRTGGAYTDAYADNLALVLSVPGVTGDPAGPPVRNLRPFSGITVLTPRLHLSRRGSVRVRIACGSSTVIRCAGTLELRAQLLRGLAPQRIARFGTFSVSPGGRRNVTLQLTAQARRALRRRTSFRATLQAVVGDGQGLQRRMTVPLRVRRSRGR
jgi:hypothetical protein